MIFFLEEVALFYIFISCWFVYLYKKWWPLYGILSQRTSTCLWRINKWSLNRYLLDILVIKCDIFSHVVWLLLYYRKAGKMTMKRRRKMINQVRFDWQMISRKPIPPHCCKTEFLSLWAEQFSKGLFIDYTRNI